MKTQLRFLNILHIFNDGYQAAFLLLLPFIARELDISLTQIGSLGSLFFLFETLLALPAGIFGEKTDGMKILLAAMLFYCFGFFGLSFVHSFPLLILFFVMAGIGFGIFHPIGFAMVAAGSEKNSRGRNIGDFTAVGDIGRIGLSAALTFLAARVGWRNTSVIYAMAALAFLLFLAAIFTGKKMGRKIREEVLTPVSLRHLLRNRKFMLACMTAFCDTAASSSLFVFLPFLLLSKGIDPEVLGSFAAAYFVGNFLGKSLIGRLVDRVGSTVSFIMAELTMAVIIVLLALASSPLAIIILSVVLGILTKGTVPARASMAIEAVEHHGRYEKANALLIFIASMGIAGASFLFGRLADVFHITYVFYASALIAVLAIFPALAFRMVKSAK